MKPFVDVAELYVDDRGSVYCAMDNMSRMGATGRTPIKRTYVVHNWEKGRIRAWHGHAEGWTGLHVIGGAAKIVAIPMNQQCTAAHCDSPNRVVCKVLSDKAPGILWVPPGWFNGHMSLEDNTKILVYSTHTFEEVKADDIRQRLTDADIGLYFKVRNR